MMDDTTRRHILDLLDAALDAAVDAELEPAQVQAVKSAITAAGQDTVNIDNVIAIATRRALLKVSHGRDWTLPQAMRRSDCVDQLAEALTLTRQARRISALPK